jgi:hypothetical protein
MGVTREDRIRRGRWLEVPDAEWEQQLASVNQALDGYLGNDAWAPKIKKDVLVLLISHPAGRCYLTGSLRTHKDLGYWIAVAYDNYFDPALTKYDWDGLMPAKDQMDMIDSFFMGHHQTWGGVSYPFMWLLRIAAGFGLNFKYVYCINGDCIIEKPEGFPMMIETLGDADIMSSGPALEREIGTAGLLMRSQAFFGIAKHMVDHVVPFEEYEKSTQDFGNTEGRLAVAVRDLGLKQVIVEPGYNEQLHIPGHGFWWKTIGFRHIHGEHNYAYRYHAIPPESKYFDPRFMGDEYNQILRYHETKDKSILEAWWEKG